MRLFLSFSNTMVVMFNLFWVNSLIFWLFFYQFLGVAQAQCCNWTLCNYNVTWAALTEAPSMAAPLTNLHLVNVALALLITFLVNKGQKWSTKPNNMYVGKLESELSVCASSAFFPFSKLVFRTSATNWITTQCFEMNKNSSSPCLIWVGFLAPRFKLFSLIKIPLQLALLAKL